MKKSILFLLILLPAWAWGQKATHTQGHNQNEATSHYMPYNSIMIDGILMDSSFCLSSLSPHEIESINFIKDSKYENIFGDVKGTIVITTKKYETIVIAPGFESFLATQQPKGFYSESSLKTTNALMVSEWNIRQKQPLVYDPKIYEEQIDYDPKTDYGLDVEYILYMFFRFMEKEHKMSLLASNYTNR